jgi:hypothetical protein
MKTKLTICPLFDTVLDMFSRLQIANTIIYMHFAKRIIAKMVHEFDMDDIAAELYIE